MSIQDNLIVKYFTLLTDLDANEVRKFGEALKEFEKHQEAGDPYHPMNVKKALARAIVTEYHSTEAAKIGEEHFEKVVQRKETPDDMPLRSFACDKMGAIELVANLASVSASEARRLISQGGVKVAGNKVSEPGQEVSLTSEEQVVQVGKRKFFRVRHVSE
jgi:tyrosyl-tRNA synthetase